MRVFFYYFVTACILLFGITALSSCNGNYEIQQDEIIIDIEQNPIEETDDQEIVEDNERTVPSSTTTEVVTYPFDEFKGRWNALSDELFSELYIIEFKKTEHESGKSEFYYIFQKGYELFVITGLEQAIEQIKFVGKPTTEEQRYEMLTGWSQVILLSNLNFDYYDVNLIFEHLGIKPNATIDSSDQNINYKGVEFGIIHGDGSYIFEANY